MHGEKKERGGRSRAKSFGSQDDESESVSSSSNIILSSSAVAIINPIRVKFTPA